MKYLPIHLLTAALLLCSKNGAAQQWYTKVAGGYAVPLPFNNTIEADPYPLTGSGQAYPLNEHYDIGHASLLSGKLLNIREGVYVGDNFSLELGILAGIAPKRNEYQTANVLKSRITIYSKNPVFLNPAVGYTARRGRRSFFGSAGLCLPISKLIFTETEGQKDTYHFYDKTVMNTKFSLGFTLTGGYQFPVSKTISMFAELSFMDISVLTQEMDVLESSANGESVLDSRTQSERQVYYEQGAPFTPGVNPDKTMVIPAYRLPFSNWGGNIGLLIYY